MHSEKHSLEAIGLMSGTSLDGLDIAWCSFGQTGNQWTFQILAAETLPYPAHWEKRLRGAISLTGEDLMQLHSDYGRFLGKAASDFIKKHGINPQIPIASHGHTVFHQPQNGFTFQLGCGAALASETCSTVVCDFRSLDVALGGQGAPLVPIGDELLFGHFTYCLNLGGFANISMQNDGSRVAFDICPANIVLNHLVAEAQLPGPEPKKNMDGLQSFLAFDPEGSIAATGQINLKLLHDLDNLDYYKTSGPRSLGQEWVHSVMLPVIRTYPMVLPDVLRTLCEHIAKQIAMVLTCHTKPAQLLATGGGVLNSFLMQLINREAAAMGVSVVVPDLQIVQFKEALVFAFLGVLRLQNKVNALSSVTGARHDSVGGAVYTGSSGKYLSENQTKEIENGLSFHHGTG